MVGTSNFLICLNISSRVFEQSRVLAHPCPPPPFPLPPHPPTSNWKGHSWFSKSKHNFLPFLEYKSVCTWRSMYWKDCISNAKAKQLKKYLLFPWNTNQCVRDGPWTGRIVYRIIRYTAKAKQLKKYLLFPCCAKNICQYLDRISSSHKQLGIPS